MADRCRSSAGSRPGAGDAGAPASTASAHRPTVGTRAALSWGAGGPPNGLGRDLRPDEALGPTYTSEPLETALEILGVPEVVLHLSVSAPVATAVVRLTDVAPDGTSAQVTRRDPQPDPSPLARRARSRSSQGASRRSACRCAPPAIGSCPAIASGSRSRRRPGRSSGRRRSRPSFELHHGGATPSRLVLPVIPPAGGPGDVPVPAFKTTPPDAPAFDGGGSTDEPVWRITDDVIAGTVTVSVHDGGEDVLEDGRRLYAAETLTMTASDADPARAILDADVVYRWREHDFETEIRARSTQTSDAEAFHLTVDLEVDLDGEPFFQRAWHESIERHLV